MSGAATWRPSGQLVCSAVNSVSLIVHLAYVVLVRIVIDRTEQYTS